MFRELVSSLAYSPALVAQLSFYARRLKKEEITRRLGLFLTIIAISLQSFAVFKAPEAAFAASPSNLIYGGVNSASDILKVYDNPTSDFKDIVSYFGITREEIAKIDTRVNFV